MERAEQTLYKLLDKIAKEQQYEDYSLKWKLISSDGANYTSVLYVATISSPNKEELFAKIAAINKKARETMPDYIYYIERYVYRVLMKEFRMMEDKCKVQQEDRFVVPKLFGYNSNLLEETLVLENLTAKGYTTYDRMKSIDWPYASTAVEVLANFHALSIAYSEQYPEEYQNLYKELAGKLDQAYETMDHCLSSSLKVALKVTTDEYKERLVKYFEDDSKCKLLPFIRSKRRTVLIHGDYKQSNLMHKTNEDGTLHIIPVDFQTMQLGCIMSDLIYFIFTGSDEDFRANYYEKLIEHYYNHLCYSLRGLRLDPDEVYSREDFEFEYKETLPYGLLCSVMFLPMITVEAEDAMSAQEENYFENLVNTKTSTVYPKRMQGVINDFARWGII